MKHKFAPAVSAMLLAVAVSSQLACTRPSPPAGSRPPAVPVQVLQVRSAPFQEVYEYAGTVRARDQAVIASKVMGTILQVTVKLGDRIRQGQPLIQIESAALDADLAAAKAGAAAARDGVVQAEKALEAATAEAHLAAVTFRRFQELSAKRSISPHEFDQAEARRKSAEAARQVAVARLQEARARREQAAAMLESARIRKGYADIAAPFDGIVTAKQADPGTLAMPGVPLLRVEKQSGYRLEASVPESRLEQVKMGERVQVILPAIPLQATGRVVEIEPAAQTASRSSLVKISLPADGRLRSGMFGRALISRAGANALAVPQRAVLRRGQLTSVFVVSDGVIRQRLVTLGRRSGDSVEVLSGLSDGDRVVTSAVENLVDGTPAEIRP